MKQGGRYGVRLKASAPSLHIIRADIETTVSPIVGNEKQSEDMVNYLLQEFEGDTTKIWQSNIFGRSFHEIVNEDLQAKLKHMPDDARLKLRQTLERIINEGTGGLICHPVKKQSERRFLSLCYIPVTGMSSLCNLSFPLPAVMLFL